jgi:DNA-binding NarL/FixJ family response regulator
MDLAVLDPLPLYRLGVLAALGGGHDLGSTAELTAWLAPRRPAVLLLTLDDDNDEAIMTSLQQHPDVRTVAVLPIFTVASAARVLRAGAAHVVARNAEPHDLRDVVEVVEAGIIRVALPVLRAATARPRSGFSRASPSDEELVWLRALAAGRTVAALAAELEIPERRLYRRLNQLYHRWGVANRTQALMVARDEGWL